MLISNHPDLSAKDISIEYRNQSVVENRFKFIKDPIYFGPLHLKCKDRLKALCYVALIALALYMILQIRVHKASKNENEPVVLAGKKKSFSSTANKIRGAVCPNQGAVAKRWPINRAAVTAALQQAEAGAQYSRF